MSITVHHGCPSIENKTVPIYILDKDIRETAIQHGVDPFSMVSLKVLGEFTFIYCEGDIRLTVE